MAKLRLHVAGLEIVMRKIISVTIDGINFKKEDYKSKDSRVLVGFYNLIRRNKDCISHICYKDHEESDYVICAFLSNCKLHSEDFPAYIRRYGDIYSGGVYYLDGNRLEFSDWLKKSRRYKLERLKEK